MSSLVTRIGSLAAWAALVPLPAAAQAPGPALRWHCTQQYDAAYEVSCVPRSPDAVAAGLPDTRAAPTGARDMRPVALRGADEVFSTEAWLVPLHVEPRDESFVVQLLESVLCGRQPDCAVRYESRLARTARR